jgi:hypothetical protein
MRYSAAAKQSLLINDEAALGTAMVNMKSYWKFMGIVMIVVLALMVLCIPIAAIGALAA